MITFYDFLSRIAPGHAETNELTRTGT